jgi:chromosome partitioning protein
MAMRTVAFLNKKGGVGKTSACHHLSGALGQKGLRVLLVDADPQASLTQGLLGPEAARTIDPRRTIATIFDEAGGPPVAELIRGTAVAGVSLLPGSEAMEDLNVTRPSETGPLQFALRDALTEVADGYDLTLIDCPPNVQLCSWAALVAADGAVVPLQAEDYGAQGLVAIRRSMNRVVAEANPQLRLIGYLITMFNKSLAVHVSYEADLRQIYGNDVFATIIPLAKDFKEAVILRQPVGKYKPKSAAAKVTAGLADELLERLESRVGADERRVA